MATSVPSYDGAGYGFEHDEDRTPTTSHTEGSDSLVQPTDNPYHWEVPGATPGDVSTWVKASWSRTNDIVRLPTDGRRLKRNAAVRRSGKGRTASDAGPRRQTVVRTTFVIKQDDTNRHIRPLCKPQVHRRFSFEGEEHHECLPIPSEECEEASILEIIMRVDSGVKASPTDRCTRFREKFHERPQVARTFAEILGEPFVPTAFANDE